ncbi:MAG: PD-(D/E)XK nuclease family protein, partial [Trueperaceae bacterium]|nr:PD-(D/E)XK nuclease family protein [Trueperaceae bacterium]
RREHWTQLPRHDRAPADVWEVITELIHDTDGQAEALEALEAFAERWLDEEAREIVERIVTVTPFGAWASTLENMRNPDAVDVRASILWSPAGGLPSQPRPYTWLLGLSSQEWPRTNRQDPLLPLRILESRGVQLEEQTRGERDRALFDAIRHATESECVVSRPRATTDGKPRLPSPLIATLHVEERTVPYGDPVDAPLNDQHRSACGSDEVLAGDGVRAAVSTLHAWTRVPSLTAHDGRVRANHPALQRAVREPISPSKIVKLVRDPFGFVATHVHRWQEPPLRAETLTMDPRDLGTLFHHVLEHVVDALEAQGASFSPKEPAALNTLDAVLDDVRDAWGGGHVRPPRALWHATLEDVRAMAQRVLLHARAPLDGERSYTEVRFGFADSSLPTQITKRNAPWDPATPYVVPGTAVRLRGIIDRIDVSDDRRFARVIDYKTGRPKGEKELRDGREVQRAAYASVVRAHLPAGAHVEASLVYVKPTAVVAHSLSQPVERHEEALAGALRVASERLVEGFAHPGRDALTDRYRDHRIALPASAREYQWLKEEAFAGIEREVLMHFLSVDRTEKHQDADAIA